MAMRLRRRHRPARDPAGRGRARAGARDRHRVAGRRRARRGARARARPPRRQAVERAGRPRTSAALLSRGLRSRASSAPRAGSTDATVVGTLDYVAPEQIRGDPVDARADVYSLGCLLFECLTGEAPFRRAIRRRDGLRAPRGGAPAAASERRAGACPRAVDAVLARGMAKVPAQRHDLLHRPRRRCAHGTRGRPARTSPPLAPCGRRGRRHRGRRGRSRPARDRRRPRAGDRPRRQPRRDRRGVARGHRAHTRPRRRHAARRRAGKVWFDGGDAIWRLDPDAGARSAWRRSARSTT